MVIRKLGAWLRLEAEDCLRVTLLTVLTQLWMAALAVAVPLVLLSGSADFLVVDLEVTALLGLAAGFGSRLILRKRTLLMQIAAASTGVLLSLLIIGYLTSGKMGLYPATGAGGLDDLIRLLISFTLAWLFLLAFRRKRKTGLGAAGVERAAIQTAQASTGSSQPQKGWVRMRVAAVKKNMKNRTAFLRKNSTAVRKPSTRVKTGGRSRSGSGREKAGSARKARTAKKAKSSAAAVRTSSASDAKKPLTIVKSRQKSAARMKNKHVLREQISLNGLEEHRCPYCLDIVEKKDPRGVKICPVCHTWHHADCWAVTGSCQIPHKHE
ncbi:MAG: hypothetical protein JXA25_13610 [Anaerolineales bacterium]|nr:hypothetical protein [Anaerolineales bacterium]